MKGLSIILFLLLSTSVFSQKNEFRLRLNQISFINSTEEVRTEDVNLIITPSDRSQSFNFSADIAYLRDFKNIKLLFRFGYTGISKNGELKLARENFYLVNTNETIRKSIELGTGVYRPFKWKEDKLILNIGLVGSIRYNYFSTLNYYSDAFNNDNQFFSGINREYNFTNYWRVGLSFDTGLYYELFKSFGIGVESNNLLFFNRTKGLSFEERTVLDENRNPIDITKIEHDENRSRIGKFFSFSLVFLYKF